MQLIADSGSTKVDWQLVSPEKKISFYTKGMNPYFVSSDEIINFLRDSPALPYQDRVESIHFYGAGCGTNEQQQKVQLALTQVFPQAKITIEGDLLGAARATCGNTNGIVCILGTGSNSCLFLDGEIAQSSPSNGIWLGDEGSAGYLGKQLITDYLNNELPSEVKTLFEKRFTDRRAEILHHIYQQATPNSYLASFSKFIAHHLTIPYFVHIVYQAFDRFCEKTICKYPNYTQLPLYFVGSIAHHYKAILKQVLADRELYIKSIVTKPIDGLVYYHTLASKKR